MGKRYNKSIQDTLFKLFRAYDTSGESNPNPESDCPFAELIDVIVIMNKLL